jgi:tryptophanyl-tRNA synthetase
MGEGLRIDPWSSSQPTDYANIIAQFGLQSLDDIEIPDPSHLHRRGLIFAHRDLDVVLSAQSAGQPFGVLTGLMPSGRMHLGHKMVIDQISWFQNLGGDVTIAVADLESNATRGLSLERARKVALEEYVANYAALGLRPESTQVYFQSTRSVVQKMAFTLGKRINLSEFEAIYGFSGDTNLAHVQAPLVQAGDILHPMLDEYGGLRPIVVPVGIDQDPHLRLTRGLAAKSNWFNLNSRKGGGLTIGLSVQDDNSTALGVAADGKLDSKVRQSVIDNIVAEVADLGFADILPNAKHGSVQIPSATQSDRSPIKMKLLRLERSMGGAGLLQPASTYHRFAVGLTGDKMSSSVPNSTIFLTDEVAVVEKKIKRAFSGGQPTVEEHRRLGGDPDVDVAYQYMMYFFEDDDKYLAEVNVDYRSGKILAGEMKQLCIDRASEWLTNHQQLRDQTAHLVHDFLAADSR